MIRANVIIPKGVLFDPVKLFRVIDTTLDGVAEGMRVDFEVTTQTWKSKPLFWIKADKMALSRAVGTDSRIYYFVSRGTSVRYAIMSRNFRPKTRVGWIGSNKGRGGMVFISKKHPRPGIQARQFEDIIAKKWIKNFPDIMQRAINAEALRASFGK